MFLKLSIKKYIAEPYWPELCQRIEVDTKSRVHRIRNEEKRKASLDSYLTRIGQDMAWYDSLHEKEKEKFYKDDAGYIMVPAHQIRGCLLEGVRCDTRGWKKKGLATSNFRVFVDVSDFKTMDKTEKDGVFDRYIKNMETNMRRRTLSEYITDFEAWGEVKTDEVEDEDVVDLFRYALKYCGVGGARKMAYGRGKVNVVDKLPDFAARPKVENKPKIVERVRVDIDEIDD